LIIDRKWSRVDPTFKCNSLIISMLRRWNDCGRVTHGQRTDAAVALLQTNDQFDSRKFVRVKTGTVWFSIVWFGPAAQDQRLDVARSSAGFQATTRSSL